MNGHGSPRCAYSTIYLQPNLDPTRSNQPSKLEEKSQPLERVLTITRRRRGMEDRTRLLELISGGPTAVERSSGCRTDDVSKSSTTSSAPAAAAAAAAVAAGRDRPFDRRCSPLLARGERNYFYFKASSKLPKPRPLFFLALGRETRPGTTEPTFHEICTPHISAGPAVQTEVFVLHFYAHKKLLTRTRNVRFSGISR